MEVPMSRDMLDKSLAGERSDIPDYEPGIPAFPKELLEDVMGYFDNGRWGLRRPEDNDVPYLEAMGRLVPHHIENLEQRIARYHDQILDVNIFLNSVIMTKGDMNPHFNWPQLQYLDRLLQALYNQGFNDFQINLNSLATPLSNTAFHLEGTEDNPLTATYVGDVGEFFGVNNKHCDLTLIGGADYTARESEHCTYRYAGWVKYFGGGSSDCEFHVPDFDSLLRGCKKSSLPWDCSVHVHSPPTLFDHAAPLTLYRNDFYRHRNRLHVKMKDSSWKEWRFP